MNQYQPSIPRVALGIATVVMTAVALAVSVVLPAQTNSASPAPRVLAASKATVPASMSFATVMSIDVVGVREPASSAVPIWIGEVEPQPARLAKTASPAVACACPPLTYQ